MEEKILDAFQEELPAEVEYVSLIRRFNATIFDSILSAAITYGTTYFIPGLWNSLSVTMLFPVMDLTYKVVGEKVFGQTLGKKAANIAVTTEDLQLISWRQALVRNYYYVIAAVLSVVYDFVFYISRPGPSAIAVEDIIGFFCLLFIVFLIDCFMMVREPKNQTLHDKWAKTMVVRESFLRK